ncbi:hypothetical protein O3P69_001749 [Scylla paramamosain]|uniref:Actin-related protein 8 n=1 Tax=Scylla paramamosain TaxID=85552 RepID=A0AAW0V1U9_SCYPA
MCLPCGDVYPCDHVRRICYKHAWHSPQPEVTNRDPWGASQGVDQYGAAKQRGQVRELTNAWLPSKMKTLLLLAATTALYSFCSLLIGRRPTANQCSRSHLRNRPPKSTTTKGHCISTVLNVPLKDLKFYRAVLIIPDIYNRDHIKKLTNLLLNGLGFGGCFVLQDHVAATFGAGLGYACVVDVGDQKTSVSCVEDAISHPATRLRLDYGGGDVTQVFYWLLKKSGFPHPVNLSRKLDAMLLNKLKHEFCHVNLNECGAQEKTFTVHSPGEVSSTYTIQMGDELIVAALSLFYPDLLKITGSKSTITQKPNPGDPDDPFDENYLRETSRRGGREAAEAMEVGGGEGGDAGEEDIVVDDQPLPPAQIVPSASSRNDTTAFTSYDKLLSLEQAILTSIERCQSDEMKRKMYSSILIVGGGAKFKNIGKWLQSRLALQIPVAYRPEQIEVITRAKDMDPCMTSWKGAALMTCLEGSGELWIQHSEWNKHGVKILREKCPFIW